MMKWDYDPERGALAATIKGLPGFEAGNGVYTDVAQINKKLNAFSNLLCEALRKESGKRAVFINNIASAHESLVSYLRPGCYLDAQSGHSAKCLNLTEKSGFLFVSVRWLDDDEDYLAPVDFFRMTADAALREKSIFLAEIHASEGGKKSGGPL